MLPRYDLLRYQLHAALDDAGAQGHATGGLREQLAALPDSYDALFAFAGRVAALPLRPDWPYVEPDDLDAIRAECDPARPLAMIAAIPPDEAAARAETAFLGSVCGCILGKPLEIRATLPQIRAGLERIGEWPLRDYVPAALGPAITGEKALTDASGLKHGTGDCLRGRIAYVAPDDDINYSVLGLRILERHGTAFTTEDVRRAWLENLPVLMAFGAERQTLVKAAVASLAPGTGDGEDPGDTDAWASILNPRSEWCGALIRADAYGYACPGQPALAAELAWRDARLSHRRTGVYGAMFVAAAIATAFVARDPLDIFATALRFVPRRSRFYEATVDCLAMIREATDWLDGYGRVHAKYGAYGHCRVYQEVGTLMNTLRFAEEVGDGICKQVMQGNDADSFGATAGSLLGAYFGPAGLESRWMAPFNDRLVTRLAAEDETRLSAVARRVGALALRTIGMVAKGRSD